MFILGISQMDPAEKAVLLAQLNALNGANVLNQGAQKTVKAAKSTVLKGIAKIASLGSWQAQESIEEFDSRLEWNTDVVNEAIEREVKRLSGLPGSEIDRQLQNRIRVIAGVGQSETIEATASAIVHKAAKALKIDDRLYWNSSELEEAVFVAAVREQLEYVKRRLERMSPDEQAKLESYLDDEISRLSKADREAIARATGIDAVSGRAVMRLFRTASGVFLAQTIIGSFGFGAFVFLTTVMKAFSLLLGVTFSFGVYTAATTTLAFLLSGPFFILSGLVAGGLIYRGTSGIVNSQLAKMLVIVGKGRLSLVDNSPPGQRT